jgi:pilus assembly protein Flp/PilA
MSNLAKRFARLWKVEVGPTAVEYAVMLALLIVVCVTAIGHLGGQANGTFGPQIAKPKVTRS